MAKMVLDQSCHSIKAGHISCGAPRDILNLGELQTGWGID